MNDEQSLAERLTRLEDERAIERVLKRLAWAGDHGRREDWLDCFTEDGRLDFKSTERESSAGADVPPALNIQVQGREGLVRFYESLPRLADVYNKHFLADQVITLSGDEATSETYIALIRDVDGAPQLNSTGRYFDKLRRDADGKWRITERVGRIDTMARG